MGNEELWAWFAGLFEGEGSVPMPNKKGTQLRMKIGMSDQDMLQRVADLVGGKVLGPYGPYKSQRTNVPMYFWEVTGATAIATHLRIRPWLSQRRRDQFDAAVLWRDEHVRRYSNGF